MVPRATARRRWGGDEGTSAVEYGLLVAAIAAVIVGVVFAVGTQMRHTLDRTCELIAAGGQTQAAAPADARRPALAPAQPAAVDTWQ